MNKYLKDYKSKKVNLKIATYCTKEVILYEKSEDLIDKKKEKFEEAYAKMGFISFEDYANFFIQSFEGLDEIKRKTFQKNLACYFNLLKDIPINKITKMDIQKANLVLMQKKLKNKTINIKNWALKILFDLAVLDGIVSKNIMKDIPNLINQRFNKPYLNNQEILEILLHHEDNTNGTAFAFALTSGIEPKYFLCLEKNDIDYNHKTICIHKKIDFGVRKEIEPITLLKNEIRTVPVSSLALSFLKEEIDKNKNRDTDSNYIFLNQNGALRSLDNYRDNYKRYALKHGITYNTVNVLIFTYGIVAFKMDAPTSSVFEKIGVFKSANAYLNPSHYDKFEENNLNFETFLSDELIHLVKEEDEK